MDPLVPGGHAPSNQWTHRSDKRMYAKYISQIDAMYHIGGGTLHVPNPCGSGRAVKVHNANGL